MGRSWNAVWLDQTGEDIAEYAVMLAVILVLVVRLVRLLARMPAMFFRKLEARFNNPMKSLELQDPIRKTAVLCGGPMKIIRCPYCVETEGFRPMTVQGKGDWLICDICGHLALPSNPLFECTCSKCVVLRGDVQDRNAQKE